MAISIDSSTIGKLYEFDGNNFIQIKKVWDVNETSNSLIYSADPIILWQGGTTTDSGTWTTLNNGYVSSPELNWTNADLPTPCIAFKYGGSKTSGGAIAQTGKAIPISAGDTLSITLRYSRPITVMDSNVATWYASFGVIFSPTKLTALEFDAGAQFQELNVVNFWTTGGLGPSASKTFTAGTYTATVPVSGSFYIGLALYGYDYNVGTYYLQFDDFKIIS